MAIQFPNFLAAQLAPADYSGFGDIFENYYKGKNMPNDALIKQIQAEFARPNAENDAKIKQVQADFARPNAENEALINRIAAQYARPNAQTSLDNARISGSNAKLTGSHLQMQIAQLKQQLEEQAQMEAAIRQALQQGGVGQQGNASPQRMPIPQQINGGQQAMPPASPQRPAMPIQNDNDMPGFDAESINQNLKKFDKFGAMPNQSETLHGLPKSVFHSKEMQQLAPLIAQSMQPQQPQSAPAMQPATLSPAGEPIKINGVAPEQTPAMLEAQKTSENETIVSKGSPHLYGIDELYNNNPQSRAALEKKGYKKTVQTKFDNKTGATTILTTNPSGKVTKLVSAPLSASGDGIPLTSAMVTQNQKVINGVDNALPIIEEILKKPETFMGKHIQQYPRSSGWMPGTGYLPGLGDASNKYENQVNAAVDSLINAYGLNKSDKSTEMVHSQALIGHNETDAAYKRRLKELVKDLQRRKAYAENEVKRSNKLSPISSQEATANDIPDDGNYDELPDPSASEES